MLRNQMRAEIIKLRQRIDTTFIYVTHDQTEAMTLGDRIVIMKDGFIQQIGTPQQVFDHPANIFCGRLHRLSPDEPSDAKLVKDGAGYYCTYGRETRGALRPHSEGPGRQGRNSMDVTLGCRPEHMTQGRPPTPPPSTPMDVSEMMGSEVHLHVVAGEKDVVLRIPPPTCPPSTGPAFSAALRSTSPSPRTWSILLPVQRAGTCWP